MIDLIEERKKQIAIKGKQENEILCSRPSIAGSVSQRACVFCGSRVVLYPIADALHLVHGPIGCAAYTWDIRGAMSSGPQIYRNSFSTDLCEQDVISGGEKKLRTCLIELIDRYRPKAAFVYSTCIVGLIGDDVDAVCKSVESEKNIPVIPVHSEGFKGTKKDGYQAACEALMKLIGTKSVEEVSEFSVNLLGEFNLAGETWIIKRYLEQMGINVIATITGDGRVDEIRKAHGAKLNVVQCAGSMIHLAKKMQSKYGIPFIRASYFGIEDMSSALYDIADFFGNKSISQKTAEIVKSEINRLLPALAEFRKELEGRKAAIYVGGAFKAFSLVKALRSLGMKTVLVGSQTGNSEDYKQLKEICDEGTIIVDDSNPLELASFIKELNVDILIGGVKERPIAYKLGIGFCDHNHERKIPLAGFEGMFHFAKEVYSTVKTPIWSNIRGQRSNSLPIYGEKTLEYLKWTLENNSANLRAWRNPLYETADMNSIPKSDITTDTAQNTCKLCAPLGASLAFKGIEGGMTFLHGSQGCATYIRRYVISHFREPFDIASSSFTEADTIFGGIKNFSTGIDNVRKKYNPSLIGVATTCLAETIGEDIDLLINSYTQSHKDEPIPFLVHVSTPSYKDTYSEGFHNALQAILEKLSVAENPKADNKNSLILPGILSPADIRQIKYIAKSCGIEPVLLPDYSETLDAPLAKDYVPLPLGGTPVEKIINASEFPSVIQFGVALNYRGGPATVLEERYKSPVFRINTPIGLSATDNFIKTLRSLNNSQLPENLEKERGRLLDTMVDAHKYLFGLKAGVFGEENLVIALCGFLAEIGVIPILCATDAKRNTFSQNLENIVPGISNFATIIENADFAKIANACNNNKPDILLGNSKGYPTARELDVPLIRVGFPIHDRFGSSRILVVGYNGAMELIDKIINSVLEKRQSKSEIGYSYL